MIKIIDASKEIGEDIRVVTFKIYLRYTIMILSALGVNVS
jgi:hypothetical protein